MWTVLRRRNRTPRWTMKPGVLRVTWRWLPYCLCCRFNSLSCTAYTVTQKMELTLAPTDTTLWQVHFLCLLRQEAAAFGKPLCAVSLNAIIGLIVIGINMVFIRSHVICPHLLFFSHSAELFCHLSNMAIVSVATVPDLVFGTGPHWSAWCWFQWPSPPAAPPPALLPADWFVSHTWPCRQGAPPQTPAEYHCKLFSVTFDFGVCVYKQVTRL